MKKNRKYLKCRSINFTKMYFLLKGGSEIQIHITFPVFYIVKNKIAVAVTKFNFSLLQ